MSSSSSSSKKSHSHKKHHHHSKSKCYDFIVVGAGNAGCVVANRLSENGKFTVCLIEAGRDDSRLPELLPEVSPAPVPQPGDYHWGSYVRGTPYITNFPGPLISRGFGHFEWFQEEDENGPVPSRKTTQARHSGWGGCTSHNFTVDIRNAPHNWNQWVALGLTDWDASTPTSNLIQYYKKVENRSAVAPAGTLGPNDVPFFDPSLPAGSQGSYSAIWYGSNGQVPLEQLAPIFGGAANPFAQTILNFIGNTLNTNGFSYPTTLVDLDYPPTAAIGGLSFNTWTSKFQPATIVPPPNFFGLPQTRTSMANYNTPMYPDMPLFMYPPEYARLGLEGPTVFERVSSAQSYLYPALSRKNLTVLSEKLVTKVIISKGRAKGVEYLDGWNIYQVGRNNNVLTCGYGGTSGDARANAAIAKQKGTHKVKARKEVIICAGAFNSPQILQLSGVGDPKFLESLGIRCKANVPGVGKNLVDNNELFIICGKEADAGVVPLMFGAKSKSSLPNINFELITFPVQGVENEQLDPFIQKGWLGLKHTPAIYQSFVRNDFENILIDVNQNPVDKKDLVFKPIMVPPNEAWFFLMEQEENVRTRGSVYIVSKDPTVPPKIIYNYMQDPQDMQDWVDIFYSHVAPLLLSLKGTPYFTQIYDPAPVDFLKPGVTFANWTDVSQIDEARLRKYFANTCGGHHAGGTCGMGVTDKHHPKYNPLAVVDQKGRVKHVKGLRVCDMSVVPVSVRWPNGTAYVIGEKISADILASH